MLHLDDYRVYQANGTSSIPVTLLRGDNSLEGVFRMQELKWLEELPEQSLDAGIKLLNELGWNLQIREVDGFLFVNSGHILLLKTTTPEAVEALLYGMAISFSTLPEKALQEVRKFVKESTGS
jgi:hypothetical protein